MSKCGGHLPWNQLPLKKPPNPVALAASVYSHRSGEEVTQKSRKKEKYLPQLNIPGKFLVQSDMTKVIFYLSGEVYFALKEGSTWDYCSASELQSTNKGLEI